MPRIQIVATYEIGSEPKLYSLTKEREEIRPGWPISPFCIYKCTEEELQQLQNDISVLLEESYPCYQAGVKDGIDAIIGYELQEEIIRRDYPRG